MKVFYIYAIVLVMAILSSTVSLGMLARAPIHSLDEVADGIAWFDLLPKEVILQCCDEADGLAGYADALNYVIHTNTVNTHFVNNDIERLRYRFFGLEHLSYSNARMIPSSKRVYSVISRAEDAKSKIEVGKQFYSCWKLRDLISLSSTCRSLRKKIISKDSELAGCIWIIDTPKDKPLGLRKCSGDCTIL